MPVPFATQSSGNTSILPEGGAESGAVDARIALSDPDLAAVADAARARAAAGGRAGAGSESTGKIVGHSNPHTSTMAQRQQSTVQEMRGSPALHLIFLWFGGIASATPVPPASPHWPTGWWSIWPEAFFSTLECVVSEAIRFRSPLFLVIPRSAW